jgi:fructokinase
MRKIICFGEVLWDMLPTGKVAGGAPMNVAFHLNQFGWNCKMISKVGNDQLGEHLRQFLQSKNIPTDFIQKDTNHPTGLVKVNLDEKGVPAYDIVEAVAYDYIKLEVALMEAVSKADIFIYGSLAARNNTSRDTLLKLLGNTGTKVCDINLRAPHYSRELLELLLGKADVAKMNDEELSIISSWYAQELDFEGRMRTLKNHFGLNSLIVTKGKEGASAIDQNNKFYHYKRQFEVKVADTVGCGDAFLAGYVSKWLSGGSIPECLEFASATGAYLATYHGATPSFDENIINQFLFAVD